MPAARRLAVASLAAGLLLSAADALYWCHERFWHRDLKVTVMDVGQGSAALVEFPGGATMLIDGGGFPDLDGFDPGAAVVAPYLRRRKILTVDTLVLTHPNSDHMHGLIHIAEHFHPRALWTNGERRDTAGYRRLMAAAAEAEVRTPDFRQMPRRRTVGGVLVRVLHPPPDFLARRSAERWRDTNNNSLVLQLALGRHAFLFPGDITRRAEAELVAENGAAAASTVLVAPHHGSRSSSSETFLEAVRPEVVVVSARDRGRGRHPHPSVLERYRRLGCRIYGTERHGAVRLSSDGRRLKVTPLVPSAPLSP